jgi:hypothetical protein
MTSREPSEKPAEEPFGPGAVPTTPADVAALRRHRPVAGSNWLDELTALSSQFPGAAAALARRPTFAGMAPFSLRPDEGRSEDGGEREGGGGR